MTIQDKAKRFNKMPAPLERECRVCGCSDAQACPGGCSWVEADLCSNCTDPFNDPEHNELLDEKLRSNEQEELARD